YGPSVLRLSEDRVHAFEPWRGDVRDEELGAVGIGAGVGHGQGAALELVGVALGLVLELVARPAAAGALGVAALDHEVFDDAVKREAVVEFLAGEEDEIVDGLRGVLREQLADDPALGRLD